MKRFLLLGIFLIFSHFLFSQVAFQGFETDLNTGWAVTTDPVQCSMDGDVWDIVGSVGTGGTAILPSIGTQFWGIRDLKGPCNGDVSMFETMTFASINVSSQGDLDFSFDYNVFGFDSNDDIKYQLILDGTPQAEEILVDGASNFSTSGWKTETVFIPAATSTVSAIIYIKQNGQDDWGGIDNVQLNVAKTRVEFTSTTADVNENEGIISSIVCVSIANEDVNPTMVGVALTGGTADNGSDISNYTTQTLTFPSGSNTSQCIMFTITDDAVEEDSETLIFTLQTPTGGNNVVLGTNTTFTATILDNDFVAPNVRINELDAVSGDAEFIELFGDADFDLTGLVLVFYNGSDDLSYKSIDLDGFSLNSSGYFVICENASTTSNCNSATLTSVQDGTDAVALYSDDASNFPNDTPISLNRLIDYLIHDGDGTNDPQLVNAFAAFDAGAMVISEGDSDAGDYSIQRGSWFVAPPTPGAPNMALPVELITFRAQKQTNYINLFWQTASETHNDRFEIEHSQTGQNFRKIGEVKGAHNSHITLDYQFNHDNPANGINYYRLKQVDEDGAFEYSKVVSVKMGKDEIISIRPNLVENEMIVELAEPARTEISLEIYNIEGRYISTHQIEFGATSINLNLSELTKGTYFVKANDGGAVSVIKFMKM